MECILITGAAGHVGRTLHRGLAGRYKLLRLADIRPVTANDPAEEAIVCDVTDPAALAAAMRGVD